MTRPRHTTAGCTARRPPLADRDHGAARTAAVWLAYAAAVPLALWALAAPLVAAATVAAVALLAHVGRQVAALAATRPPPTAERDPA